MRNKIAFGLALALVLLWGAGAMAAGGVGIDWDVLAGGGGRVTAGTYSLDNTVGQANVGLASGGPSELCAGFWCLQRVTVAVYLPLILHRSTH